MVDNKARLARQRTQAPAAGIKDILPSRVEPTEMEKRLNVNVPIGVHKRLAVHVAMNDTTQKTVVVEAITAWLDAHENK